MAVDNVILVQKSLQGDRDAFGDLIRNYEHAAFGLALSYSQDFFIAEDLTQEAFISAYLNLDRLRDPVKFGPWLKEIVVNQCRNWHRSKKTELLAMKELSQNEWHRQQDISSPDQIYEAKDMRTHIMTAIGRLSQKNRQAVILYYIHDLSVEEIGAFLETSPDVINQRLHRARTQLKEDMMTMIEDILKTSHPKQFPEKVLQEIAEWARHAHDHHLPADAVENYNKALQILEEQETTTQQKRWKADMLWERSRASHFLKWKNDQAVIADMEAALQLEKELGDQSQYAKHLIALGATYANARMEQQKALQAYQEAAAIFEALGDKQETAYCLYWIATQYIPWMPRERRSVEADYHKALNLFRQAAELSRQAGGEREALSLAAVRLLEETGENPSFDTLVSIDATCVSFECLPDALLRKHQPGFGRTEGSEKPPSGAFTYILYPAEFLYFPLTMGREWTTRTFAYGTEEIQATTTVERLDGKVVTLKDHFQNCLELITVFERKGEDPSESYRRLNLHKAGTRRIWFAPGIGLVRLTYHHGDGMETNVQLTDYHVPEQTEDYFPLQLDARWNYRITNNRSGYAVKDTCWVASREDHVYFIAQFNYAEKI